MGVLHIGNRINRKGTAASRRNNLLFETLGRRYQRQMIVYTSTPADGPQTILASAELAAANGAVGSEYLLFNDSDAIATCVEVDCEETDNPRVWYLTATYDTDRVTSSILDNPLNQPPEIKVSFLSIERPLERDLFGIPVVNSSKEKFDPPFTYVDKHKIYTVVQNRATRISDDATYFNACNSGTFQGRAPYTMRINKIEATKQVSIGVFFWQHTFEIEEAPEGFWIYSLDQGFRDIDGNLFRDARDFTPLSNPSLLNGRGKNITTARGQISGPLAATDTSFAFVTAADGNLFPPGPKAGTPHWYFQCKIQDEIVTVTAGWGTGTFTVLRGQNGTTAAAYVNGGMLTLEPYYLRFSPSRAISFTDLSLPTLDS